MLNSDVETRWMKFGNVEEFENLCDDVIAITSGIYVMFINLTTREEKIEKFDSPERGKGVSRLAGHPVISIFATVENHSFPKIFIFTYPGIRKISNCIEEKCPNGYLSCTFAGNDYLLTLTSFPDFRMDVWSWKSGEKLTSIETTIFDLGQKILSSPSSPHQISQLGKTTGNLTIYEINVSSKITMIFPINENSLSPPIKKKIVGASWSSDGNLFQCDIEGTVTLNFNDGKRRHLIVQGENNYSQISNNPLIETFRSGLILVDRKSQIMFYRKISTSDNRIKSATPWNLLWSIQANSHPVFMKKSSNSENILFLDKSGEISELTTNDEDESPTFRKIYYLGAKYEFLTIVNPRGDKIVVIDEFNRLKILRCLDGKLLRKMCLKIYGNVRCVASHPKFPLLSIATSKGNLLLINVNKNSDPSIIGRIHLQRESLEMIRYSWSAKILGISDTDRSKLFIIDSVENDRYFVKSFIEPKEKITDFLIYENENESSKILILEKLIESRNIGKKVIIYSLENEKYEKICTIELSSLINFFSYGRDRNEIIVIPYLGKQLHLLEIQENFQGLNLIGAFTSGHRMRNIRVNVNDNNFVLTSGYDGLIIVRNKTNIRQIFTFFMANHRIYGGIKMALISSSNKIILSLGKNGDLVATKLCNFKTAENFPDAEDSEFRALESGDDFENNLTWMEQKFTNEIETERKLCEEERNSIFEDFSKLQKQLILLLDENEKESLERRLPIFRFDLDREMRKKKIAENEEKKIEMEKNLREEIFIRERVSKYLRKLCWDSMEVQARSLLAIDKKIKIDNFPFAKSSKNEKNIENWENFATNFWNFRERKKSNDELSSTVKNLSIIGETIDQFIPETLNDSMNQIKKCPTYIEGIRSNLTMKNREKKLKIYFNQLFENMRSMKDRELTIVAQRLEEIEKSSLELKNVFQFIFPRDYFFSQPLWHYSEKPETIVTISDKEINKGKADVYLERDNCSEIVKKKEEDDLKLNDSFREKALEIMMDGLLEVRWEDEIKKDPPRPQFLSTKDTSSLSLEETEELNLYHERCENLKKERKKYKKLLEEKIIRLIESLKKDVENFDKKMETFNLDRIKVESAILQEKLMRLRETQRHSTRIQGMEIMKLLQNELSSAVNNFRKSSELIIILEGVVNETKNRYEILSKRDKTLESKFRSEFPDLKQPMVEHLLRHYRKRPKNVQLICTSITYLTEIGRCVVNSEKSEILPKDCNDYLRGMDHLDEMPNNFPPQIDNNHWNLLCKLRRIKLELEIKMKICAVDLAEAEQTLSSHQKNCFYLESKVSQLKEAMKEREIKNGDDLEDMKIQLVLKMGQIESRLFGDVNELSNSVFVPFSIVLSANDCIIDAGQKKLEAMKKTIFFRRQTLRREWRHQCLRFELKNLKEELKTLQVVKVTKEIQMYLQNEARKIGHEKKMKSSDRILTLTKKRLSRILEGEKRRYDDIVENIKKWIEKNKKSMKSLEKKKTRSVEISMLIDNEKHERDEKFRRNKLLAIMKRTRLEKRIHENYAVLLALQTQLELLRLKTYPTLRLKGFSKDEKKEKRKKRQLTAQE